ncbi:ATP-dependent DNA helicase RecG [Humidisolicoccus flavus]|uniref:ATP-dependent DNA helicase RecG n=1 Tax=Humidisolicoccus flavus TaxID=3111414 RepID=UPI003D2FACA2
MRSGLERPLSRAVPKSTADRLSRAFGYKTVGQLLAHYPRRYATRGQLTPLDALQIGEMVTVVAEIAEIKGRDTGKRQKNGRPGRLTIVTIHDGTARLDLSFFNQAWRERDLAPGLTGVFSGSVGMYNGRRQLSHPSYEIFEKNEVDPKQWAEEPIPLYPATASLSSAEISKLIRAVLDVTPPLQDPLPEAVRSAEGLLDFDTAVRGVHAPATQAEGTAAMRTLRYHEAFILQTSLLQIRAQQRTQHATPRASGELLARFDASLPFTLTEDQASIGKVIAAEIASEAPMSRLVQGEVGSGKTLVALRAMLQVAQSGGQSVMIAPTEVLAAQHLRSIVQSLGPDLAAELRPVLITGQLPAAERKRALLAAAAGGSLIVVGTHALLEPHVQFADLGLAVIDEQHRFGVAQRERLREKGTAVHSLVLTATPIPRTVAMTVFGDLDVSMLRSMPSGRKVIESFVVPAKEKPQLFHRVWHRVAEELDRGHQSFVVCPAIDANEPDPELPVFEEAVAADAPMFTDDGTAPTRAPIRLANVAETITNLRASPVLAGKRIEGLTGAMASAEKDEIMQAFARGAIDVLVATTVIEVGVNVPNATVMVVLDAERFGVSQLHQLRGRVGRGEAGGIALLVTNAMADSDARTRVEAVAATSDGFELAELDLQLRGEGDVLGTGQAGVRSSLKLLRAVKDAAIIANARSHARTLIDEDPGLRAYPVLAEAIARRLDATAGAAITAA